MPAVAALFVGIGVAVLAGTGLLVRRFAPRHEDPARHDDAYDLFKLVGQVAALFMLFVLAQSMTYFRDAEVATSKEAGDLLQLDRSLASVGGTAAAEARLQLHRYVEVLVQAEWPAMRRGQPSPEAEQALFRLQDAVSEVLTAVPVAASLRGVQKNADDVEDDRSIRLGAAGSGIPGALWQVLGGSFVVLAAAAGFMDPTARQFRLMALYVASLCLLLAMLFMIDGPYHGGFSVGPRALERVLAAMNARL